MAVMSCEPADVARALKREDERKQEWRKNTLCLDCPYNNHHAYPIMDGQLIASICEQDGEWLTPDLYRSTIEEMGCEVCP